MTDSTIVIDGYSDSDKVPEFVGETKFGSSAISIGSIPLILLLVGLSTAAGTITEDVDVLDVLSRDDGRTFGGKGSEVSRMVLRAFDQGLGGVRLKIASPTGAGGTAASATITVTGTSTSAGTHRFWAAGELIEYNLSTVGQAQNATATAIAAKINENTDLPFTAAANTNVVTLTAKAGGIRGNQYILFKDDSKGAGGVTTAVAGGASVTGGGVFFASGTGTETLTTLLALLYPARYHRIAIAQNDATSLGVWETQIDDKAGPLQGRMEHVVVAGNGALAASTSLAQTTLNNWRFQFCWLLNSESHPSEIAAAMAAKRAAREGTTPNAGYDGEKLVGIRAQKYRADWASRTTQQSALDNSVTPLTTNENGDVVVIRAITTRSLDGSTPDYRTLDTAEAVVPDYVRDRLKLVWNDFKLANPYVAPDPVAGEKPRAAGIATPTSWKKRVHIELQKMEQELILTQTLLEANAPQASYNVAAKRIMLAAPVVPLPLHHATGVSVRQVGIAA